MQACVSSVVWRSWSVYLLVLASLSGLFLLQFKSSQGKETGGWNERLDALHIIRLYVEQSNEIPEILTHRPIWFVVTITIEINAFQNSKSLRLYNNTLFVVLPTFYGISNAQSSLNWYAEHWLFFNRHKRTSLDTSTLWATKKHTFYYCNNFL